MKILASVVVLATLLSGCFTVTGGLVGAHLGSKQRAENEEAGVVDTSSEANALLAGLLVGAAFDVLLTYAVIQQLDSPTEGTGVWSPFGSRVTPGLP